MTPLLSNAPTYQDFLDSKSSDVTPAGFDVVITDINPLAKPHQSDIIRLACRVGKFCVWAGMGLGKTLVALEWAKLVYAHTGGSVLILTPLAVAKQFVREGEKFGVPVALARRSEDVRPGINVCNYESLRKLDASVFSGVVLDESSCLKDDKSCTFELVCDRFASTPFKLACSATPSPNDYMELGSQAEFLGICTRREMLANFFTRDGSDTSKYILMGHARRKFWRWVAGWAIACNKPSDINTEYSDDEYILPSLHTVIVDVATAIPAKDGELFFTSNNSLTDQRTVNRLSLSDRVDAAVHLVRSFPKDQWIVWCESNVESESVTKMFKSQGFDVQEVKGSDSSAHKEQCVEGFANGDLQIIVTKFSIAGHGVNWQSCHRMIVLDSFNSFERIFQGTGRIYRFGQSQNTYRYFINHIANAAALVNFDRKQSQHDEMMRSMVDAMRDRSAELLSAVGRSRSESAANDVMPTPKWLVSID